MTGAAAPRVRRVFFSTGEPSGEMLAITLAAALRERVPIAAAGIGGEKMREAGFTIAADTTGWASMGPLAALGKIVPLYLTMWRCALPLFARPADLIVFVDFGAFNLRFAKTLRLFGYRGPMLYYFPPGAWLDRPGQARAVARYAVPLTAFAHQRDFYAGLGLDVAWFGHPLATLVPPRAPRGPVAADGGSIAVLPGSRRGEIEHHLMPLLGACALLRLHRPRARFTIGAANADGERLIREIVTRSRFEQIAIVRGARAALDDADAAFVASGTAVLEAALREVPSVAFYIVSAAQAKIARRVWRRPYYTLPNLLLERGAIPEITQEAVTPEALAPALEALLTDPSRQLADLRAMRARLGPPDALARCAAFAAGLLGADDAG